MYIYTDLYLYSSNEEFAIYDKWTHKSQCSSPTYQYYTAMLDAQWQKTRQLCEGRGAAQMSDSLLCWLLHNNSRKLDQL